MNIFLEIIIIIIIIILGIYILFKLYKLYSLRNLSEREVQELLNNRKNLEKINKNLFIRKEKYFNKYLSKLQNVAKTNYAINIKRECLVVESVKLINDISKEQFKNDKLKIYFDDDNNDIDHFSEWIELAVSGILDPIHGLFIFSSSDDSHVRPFYGSENIDNHLSYFYFIGRLMAYH